jgi:uncharacterized protein YcbK (DUF882 family)
MNESKSPEVFRHHSSQRDVRVIGRRGFLKAGILAAAAVVSPRLAFGASRYPERSLAFYNTHTGESLKTVYWFAGNYLPEGVEEINLILRDYRTGEIKSIDRRLLDLLFELRTGLETTRPFHIISGYRSAETNALLRASADGIARNSLHLYGQAADIRLPGLPLSALRRAAVALKAGGVGYYPRSDFVHVDIGRVRYW